MRSRSVGKKFETFKTWVVARGAELLMPTSEYEVVRFRAAGDTCIIYQRKSGRVTFSGERTRGVWEAFHRGDDGYRIIPRQYARSGASVVIRTLLDRDGSHCFFCDVEFSDLIRPTREHLVPLTSGGPDHISNIFLACEPCNRDVGHASAAEKIRYRDGKRRGIGTALLCRVHDRLVGGEADVTLLEDIEQFLNPVLKETI